MKTAVEDKMMGLVSVVEMPTILDIRIVSNHEMCVNNTVFEFNNKDQMEEMLAYDVNTYHGDDWYYRLDFRNLPVKRRFARAEDKNKPNITDAIRNAIDYFCDVESGNIPECKPDDFPFFTDILLPMRMGVFVEIAYERSHGGKGLEAKGLTWDKVAYDWAPWWMLYTRCETLLLGKSKDVFQYFHDKYYPLACKKEMFNMTFDDAYRQSVDTFAERIKSAGRMEWPSRYMDVLFGAALDKVVNTLHRIASLMVAHKTPILGTEKIEYSFYTSNVSHVYDGNFHQLLDYATYKLLPVIGDFEKKESVNFDCLNTLVYLR